MDKCRKLRMEMDKFDNAMYKKFGCELEELSKGKIEAAGLLKAQLVDWLYLFADMYCKTKESHLDQTVKVRVLSEQVIEKQDLVIVLQERLLGSGEDQLATLQTSVREEMASVQTTVKSELQSWSEIAKRNTVSAQPAATFTPAKLKDAVRSAVEEDDRSRNLVIFNKHEEIDENIEQAVAEVFEDMNERPRVIECRRLGKFQHGKARPIKVKLTSSDAVSHILRRAKVLKTRERSKMTFIGPDRTPEERDVHRALVVQLKEKMKTDTTHYHFIRGGSIASVEKTAGTTTPDVDS
jgi:hypothetical protein